MAAGRPRRVVPDRAVVTRGRRPPERLVVPLGDARRRRSVSGSGRHARGGSGRGRRSRRRGVPGAVSSTARPDPAALELEQDTSYGMPGSTANRPGRSADHRSAAGPQGRGRRQPDAPGSSRNAAAAARVKTGASETTVVLPQAAGTTDVKAEAGAASLTFTSRAASQPDPEHRGARQRQGRRGPLSTFGSDFRRRTTVPRRTGRHRRQRRRRYGAHPGRVTTLLSRRTGSQHRPRPGGPWIPNRDVVGPARGRPRP